MSPEPEIVSNGSHKQNGSSYRTFTWQELSRHNTREDAYVSIRDKVYDITNFISKHPGGEDTLLLAAGRDATLVFETYHVFEIAQRLRKYEIGTLSSNELVVFPPPGPFFIALKKRVGQYFVDTKQDPKNNAIIWMRYAGILLSVILAYYFQFFNATVHANIYLQIITALCLGFFVAEAGQHALHDGSHFSITHSPFVWKLMSSTHDMINGCSHMAWMYQHTFGHHPYTNIDGADPDVVTANPDFRRIKPFQSYYFHYAMQHIFAPILYGLLATKTRLQDFTILFVVKANIEIRVNPLTTSDLSIFWGGKMFFVTYRILIPLLLSPYSFGRIMMLLCVADLATSYWLALLFQVSHIVKEVTWPLPDKMNFVQLDWAEMQIVTTQDYAHESTFWTFITGGLNYQAVHHLFPQVHQYYYPQIGGIVKDTCKEFGLSFLYKETFLDALSSHFGHLRNLGRNPDSKLD